MRLSLIQKSIAALSRTLSNLHDKLFTTTREASPSASDKLLVIDPSGQTTKYILYSDVGGGSSYTFENGITESGGDVSLGGALTGATTITGTNANPLRLRSSRSGTASSEVGMTVDGELDLIVYSNDNYTGRQTQIQMNDNYIYLKIVNDEALDKYILMDQAGMVIRDDQDSEGLKYHADYSSTQTARCLIEKGYVDGLYYERYVSIPGAAFMSMSPDVQDITVNGGYVSANADGISFSAAIQLPDGATVTAAVVYGDAAGETWTLHRYNMSTTGNSTMGTANVDSEDSSIVNATIDNSTYAYYFSTSTLDTGDEIHGARITLSNS